jgi:hypothetical protein
MAVNLIVDKALMGAIATIFSRRLIIRARAQLARCEFSHGSDIELLAISACVRFVLWNQSVIKKVGDFSTHRTRSP